ncbi:MAG: clostripain-related cysteine peptidase, partial [Bacteroidales bacterium]|nr:clostripain-related cysteine peptidase [Bacteroidales bacterium]
EALPMHFEYILFDACLMGGIEVAYELKDNVDQIGFSQAEVLADGFEYKTVAEHLIGDKEADTKSICSDYFDKYDNRVGVMRSATISLIDCTKLDALASECKYLFDIYNNFINAVSPSRVQRYYRFDKHWFYDMEDILVKSNIPASELERFKTALNDCIIYKAATPSFIDSFDIKTFSGFSMYLPNNGDGFIDAFYKKLAWNKATSLVK